MVLGVRIKDLTRQVTVVLQRYFRTVTASLGRDKARVLHARDPIDHPVGWRPSWPKFRTLRGLRDDWPPLDIAAHGATFGGTKLDAGTVPESESYISRSDHAAFHERGVQAAFATDGANFRTPYYHTPEDVPAHIVQPFLVGAVRTLVAGTIGMAGRPAACGG